MEQVYCVQVDEDNVVKQYASSNIAQPGMIVVSPDVYRAVQGRLGQCKFIDGQVVDYQPPVVKPPTVVTGDMWFRALIDIGLVEVWTSAKRRCDDGDRLLADLISRETVITRSDPVLHRVARHAEPTLDVGEVYDRAVAIARSSAA